MFGRKKKQPEYANYAKHINVGEFYALSNESYELPQEGVYKCIGKDEENVYFFSFIAGGKKDFYTNFRIVEKDDWPVHMSRLQQMHPINMEDSSSLFANVVRNIFQWSYE